MNSCLFKNKESRVLVTRIKEPGKINSDDLLVEESNPEFSTESDVETQGGEK